jgi:hypothetical protein
MELFAMFAAVSFGIQELKKRAVSAAGIAESSNFSARHPSLVIIGDGPSENPTLGHNGCPHRGRLRSREQAM